MSIYLASFDLKSPSHNYSTLYGALEQIGAHHAQTTTWIIDENDDARAVTKRLLGLVDKDDSLFLIEISPKTRWTATHLEHETGEWLKQLRP